MGAGRSKGLAAILCELKNSSEVMSWIDQASSPRILDFAHMLLQVGTSTLRGNSIPTCWASAAEGCALARRQALRAVSAGHRTHQRRSDGKADTDRPHGFSRDRRARLAKRLQSAQVRFFNELHDGIYGLTIYVADPDGNKVELFQEGVKLN